MKCKYTKNDMILYYYDEIDPSEGRALEEHIEQCKQCSALWRTTEAMMKTMNIDEPVMSETFWNNYRATVNALIDDKRQGSVPRSYRPGRLQTVAVLVVIIMVAVLGGVRFYTDRQEEAFIQEHFDLITNIDFFENFELLEHLEDLEEV